MRHANKRRAPYGPWLIAHDPWFMVYGVDEECFHCADHVIRTDTTMIEPVTTITDLSGIVDKGYECCTDGLVELS